MTEEEKKAIDTLAIIASTSKVDCEDYPNCICMKKDLILALNLIQSQQEEIEKKNKIIEEMAKQLYIEGFCREIQCKECTKEPKICIKQYFEEKVEEN